VLSNDTDPDGDAMTVASTTNAAHGTIVINADNTVTYTPAAAFSGTDTFTYTVKDNGTVDSTPATVSITVNAVNHPPVANTQTVTTNEDTAKAITLTASDPDGNLLTYAVVTDPAHGTLSGTAPDLTYTPTAGYHGADSFTFKVNDGTVDSTPATVSITVNAVNHPPVANTQTVTTNEDTAKAITLTGSDPDGNLLTYAVVTNPAHGTLSGTAPNLTYTPALNYNGLDTLTFVVRDGQLQSGPATVSITITPVNDPPVANNGAVTATAGRAVIGQLTATDVDSPTLTFSIVVQPKKGSVTFSPSSGVFTYTPTAKNKGTDTFTFRVYDGTAYSNIAKITVTIK
jgi:VCBS repeat-containing protein